MAKPFRFPSCPACKGAANSRCACKRACNPACKLECYRCNARFYAEGGGYVLVGAFV